MEVNKIYSKYENKGLTGLANCGNSCYLNACMQILSHTYELNEFLEKNNGEYKKKINKIADSVLLLEWDNLRKLMWSDNCTIAPNGFVKSVRKVAVIKDRDLFSGYSQNDVQEFLLFVIDCFHNALSREVDMQITGVPENSTDKLAETCYKMMQNMYKKEFSELLGIFYGIHVSAITSEKTTLSITPEPFSILSLPIPEKQNVSLYDCIDLYCAKEILTGDSAWYNDKTKKYESVNRGIVFWSLPEVLIIDLKRWGEKGKKIHKIIDAPLNNLNLSKYVKGYNPETYIYDLYGICNHHGGPLGGHYTAYIKNSNNNWYEFNDTVVNRINEENVITSMSYCFFYRKKK